MSDNSSVPTVPFDPNHPFRPLEDPGTLLIERTNIAGQMVECIAYGMEVLLFLMTVHVMLTQKGLKSSWKYLVYITVQFILVSIGVIISCEVLILAYVDNREFPGGPIPWSNAFYNLPQNVAAFVCFTLATWLQDGFLLYRFLIIWQFNWFAFVLPFMLYLVSIAFSCILMAQLTQSGLDINQSVNEKVGIVFWACSVSLNILLTTLIVARLLYLKRSISSSLGREHTKTYLSIAAMLIESAALYSTVGIAFLGVYNAKNPINSEAGSDILLGLLGVMAAFAPTLIAYRVSKGAAWTKKTAAMTSMVFTKPSNGSPSGASTTKFQSMNESKMMMSKNSHSSSVNVVHNSDGLV